MNNLTQGVRYLIGGFAVLLRRPSLAALGMLPPLIVSTVSVIGLLLLAIFGLGPITDALTAWAGDSLKTAARIVIGILVMAAAIVIIVVLFVALTLAVGAPIYEKISQNVERDLGEPVWAPTESTLRGALRGLRQSLGTTVLAMVGGLAIFFLGLIPVLGAPLALITGAIVGGFLLTTELVSGPFDRWGHRSLREKLRVVNRNRMAALGFGVPVFILFSMPILSIVFFPAATAGATLLAIDLRPKGVQVVEKGSPRD